MLDELVRQEQSSDLLSTAYDSLIRNTFLGEIGWRTWMDVAGLGISFVSGFKKNSKIGLMSYGIAAFPELWDWTYNLTHNRGTTFEEDSIPFLVGAGEDLLLVGLTYFGGRLLRAWYETRR